MSVNLVGDVALVTGGARGIGRACVEHLTGAGATVYSADIVVHEACSGAVPVVLNVADPDAVDEFVSHVPRAICVLVNNAGIYGARQALEITNQEWAHTFDININGTFYCTLAVARRLIAEGLPGAVVNISSIAGKRAFPGQADYCASKAAVLGFTRAAALDLARQSITVNAICPGTIDTPMIDEVIRDIAAAAGVSITEQRHLFEQQQPIGRLQTPADIAAGVVFLASEGARAITGESLTIDGGQTRD